MDNHGGKRTSSVRFFHISPFHTYRYARNTAGQEGAIPANYIQVITDTTEPPVNQTSHSTVNTTPVTSLDDQPPAQSKYEEQTQQYTNLTDDMNWFNNDQVAPVSDQPNVSISIS